jgi:hypothetical protein
MKPSNVIIQPRSFGALLALALAITASVVSSLARAAPPPQCPAGTVLNVQTHGCVPIKPPITSAPAAPTPELKAPVTTVHLPVNNGKPNCPSPPPCPSGAGSCKTNPTTGCMTATPATCAPGYYGASCQACPGGASNICSSNGSCNQGMGGTGACSCMMGFTGPACQYSNALTCSGHGSVTANGNCICQTGYSGPSCNL